MLSGVSASGRQARKVQQNVRQVRQAHGHGHASDAHGHHPAHSTEPYAVKHHDHYPHEAYAFGRQPGEPSEGWEVITYAVYAACAGILVIGMSTKGNDDFKVRNNSQVVSQQTSRLILCACRPYRRGHGARRWRASALRVREGRLSLVCTTRW